MPQPTLRARPKCCPVHQFLSPSRVCEDKKPPPPLLPPCHLSAEGKRVASPRLLTHTHKPRNTSTKKEQLSKRRNAQQGDRSHVEDRFKPPYSLWLIYAFTSRKYQLFIGRITVQPEQIDVSARQEVTRQDAIHQHALTHPRERAARSYLVETYFGNKRWPE